MKSRLIWEDQGERTFGLVLEPGEDALATITGFAAVAGIKTASLTAVANFGRAELGVFDLKRQTFRTICIRRPCQALSLRGDIEQGDDGQPHLHIHAVMDVEGGATRGGHLLQAVVQTSLEAILVESPPRQRPVERSGVGVALFRVA